MPSAGVQAKEALQADCSRNIESGLYQRGKKIELKYTYDPKTRWQYVPPRMLRFQWYFRQISK